MALLETNNQLTASFRRLELAAVSLMVYSSAGASSLKAARRERLADVAEGILSCVRLAGLDFEKGYDQMRTVGRIARRRATT